MMNSFKGLKSSCSQDISGLAMQCKAGGFCPNTDTQSVSCDPVLVCTDVAIICLRGGGGCAKVETSCCPISYLVFIL